MAEIYNRVDVEPMETIYVFVSIEDQTEHVVLTSYDAFNEAQDRTYPTSLEGQIFEGIDPRPGVEEGSAAFDRPSA